MTTNKRDTEEKIFLPTQFEDYIPQVIRRLVLKIEMEEFKKIALYGFCDTMKLLFRLLREMGHEVILCDWRDQYSDYDCGGQDLVKVDKLKNESDLLLVACLQDIHLLKDSMDYLIKDPALNSISTIYDLEQNYNPYTQQQPYKGIAERAGNRAKSMISDTQLFDLIQFIDQTKDVPGDVVEYGSLYGGSGAIIAEAIEFFGKKPVWLFDSFEGIPRSKYGLDHHWDGSFSDNSFKEVEAAFSDLDNVTVTKGNIMKTYDRIDNPISFGYLASDTLESGEVLLNYMWPKLSPGGIIAVCDYGSFPNCVPLTTYVDNFFKDKRDAFIFYPERIGIFIMKR